MFEIIFFGVKDDTPETLRKIKATLLADFDLQVADIQRILSETPSVVCALSNEEEAQKKVEMLSQVGAKVDIISQESQNTDEDEVSESSDGSIEFEISFDEPAQPKEPKVWSLELESNESHESEEVPAKGENKQPPTSFSAPPSPEKEKPQLKTPSLEEDDLALRFDDEPAPQIAREKNKEIDKKDTDKEVEEDSAPPTFSSNVEPPSLFELSNESDEQPVPAPEEKIEKPKQSVPPKVELSTIETESEAPQKEESKPTPPVPPPPSAPPSLPEPPRHEPPPVAPSPSSYEIASRSRGRSDKNDLFLLIFVLVLVSVITNVLYFKFLGKKDHPDVTIPVEALNVGDESSKKPTQPPQPSPQPDRSYTLQSSNNGITLSLACKGWSINQTLSSCSILLSSTPPRDPLPEEIAKNIPRAPWLKRLESDPIPFSGDKAVGKGRAYIDYKDHTDRTTIDTEISVAKGETDEEKIVSIRLGAPKTETEPLSVQAKEGGTYVVSFSTKEKLLLH